MNMFKYKPNHACKQQDEQEEHDVHQQCILKIHIHNMKE